MTNTLQKTTDFQIGAQGVMRFEGNIYVSGDNVAEHIARGCRLIAYISQGLKSEYPDNLELIQDLFATFVIHDDDEIIDGEDIVTYQKSHNAKDQDESDAFANSIHELDTDTKEYLTSKFKAFRAKDTLTGQIAKQIDNIVGNQLVIEQKIGLISPRIAKFSIDYANKVRDLSGSKTMQKLIDAQVQQVIDERDKIKADSVQLDSLLKQYIQANSAKISYNELRAIAVELLEVDVMSVNLDGLDVGLPLEGYQN